MGSLELLFYKIKGPGGRLGNLRVVKWTMTVIRFLLFLSAMAVIKVAVFLFPSLKKKLAKNMKVIYKKTSITQEDVFKFSTSSNIVRNVFHNLLQDAFKTASLHEPAPNPKLLNALDQSSCSLLDFMKADRPLVVNFGSCT